MRPKQNGFSIIELVLVLAIAGLMVALVFSAVSGAQRSRRNFARKAAVQRFLASVTQAASAKKGIPPANCAELDSFYSSTDYPCKDSLGAGDDPMKIIVYSGYNGTGKTCNDTADFIDVDSPVVAATIGFETAAQFCMDSTGKTVLYQTGGGGGGGGGGSDTENPTVAITDPSDGATVNGTITIAATASDNTGVSKVEFYVDGGLKCTDLTAPYTCGWDTTSYSNASHSVQAQAYDDASNSAVASISVTVSNAQADTQAPTVSITQPTGGTIGGSQTVSINASDNVGVTLVEFRVDGSVVQSWTSAPYTFSWDTTTVADGSHSLTAKAYDAAGNSGNSTPVTVTVAQADTQAPTVTWVVPSGTKCKNVTFTMQISATDNSGSIAAYEIWINGSRVSTTNTYTWSNPAVGTYTIEGKAKDPAGNWGSNSKSLQIATNGATC